MDRVVHAERVQDGSDLAPDLVRVDPELVEEGLLVVKVGGAAADGSRAGVDWARGGGRRGGADVEGHEGDAGVWLERRRGHAPLLEVWIAGGGVSRVWKGHRRDLELFRHGIGI